jgi:ubiquinone/menaquinone biosynthesis C-methylase UbiE
MQDTAAANGIPWNQYRAWIASQEGPWKDNDDKETSKLVSLSMMNNTIIPDYYRQAFHAYEQGNLCWEAAWEVEIASAAVGARNFPAYGRYGERAFRDSFHIALLEGGAQCPHNAVVVDLGAGTGISTRRLALAYPQASQLLGIDLSPYYCQVGTFLMEHAPIGKQTEDDDDGPWVNTIVKDDRIRYQVGDAAQTGLPDASVDIVNLQFVAHELPYVVTLDVLREAHRLLKEGGQLWFCEMDFETPGYAAQRSNPVLFSLIRSTEPYLDDYADHGQEIRDCLHELFAKTVITPATGRHFAIVATKDSSVTEHVLEDNRFDENGEYLVEDTHLKTFDNKL